MWYLFFEIWVWLVAAFFLGWFAHWFLNCRGKHEFVDKSAADHLKPITDSIDLGMVPDESSRGIKPIGLEKAPEDVDDLKQIKGIGSEIEKTLHGLGIYRFDQIDQWNKDNIAWLENFIAFPGRIEREQWQLQARELIAHR